MDDPELGRPPVHEKILRYRPANIQSLDSQNLQPDQVAALAQTLDLLDELLVQLASRPY